MDFCGSDKKYTDTPQWYDPLGPTGIDSKGRQTFSPSGGVPQRNRLFDSLTYYAPKVQQSGEMLAAGLQKAAANPGWAQAQGMARDTMAGNYLNGSPALDSAMNAVWQRQMASAADADARLRSQYSRAGMGFSTANQQASEANKAAAAAQAGQTEAAARYQNYDAERTRQLMAPQLLESATSAPLNYLSNVNSAYLTPLATEAQIVQGLAGGGQIATPNSTIVKQPGVFDYMLATADTMGNATPKSL